MDEIKACATDKIRWVHRLLAKDIKVNIGSLAIYMLVFRRNPSDISRSFVQEWDERNNIPAQVDIAFR